MVSRRGWGCPPGILKELGASVGQSEGAGEWARGVRSPSLVMNEAAREGATLSARRCRRSVSVELRGCREEPGDRRFAMLWWCFSVSSRGRLMKLEMVKGTVALDLLLNNESQC